MRCLLWFGIALLLLASAFANPAPPSGSFPKEQAFFDRMVAHEQAVMAVKNPDILFQQIGITLDKDATRARLTVQAMPDCPENAPYQPRVLQCFFLSSSNFEEKDLASGFVEFKVPKSWLGANDYDRDSVQLRRYSYSWNIGDRIVEWKKQETSFVREEPEHYVYTAKTDGISYFSIAADRIKPQTTAPVAVTGNAASPPSPDTYIYSLAPKQGKSSIDGKLASLLLVMILAASVFLLKYSEHIEKPEPTAEEEMLESTAEQVRHLLDHGYPEFMIRQELMHRELPGWLIDYAFLNARKLKYEK